MVFFLRACVELDSKYFNICFVYGPHNLSGNIICCLDSCRVPRKYRKDLCTEQYSKLSKSNQKLFYFVKGPFVLSISHVGSDEFFCAGYKSDEFCTLHWHVLTTYPGCSVQILSCAILIQTRRVQRVHWPEQNNQGTWSQIFTMENIIFRYLKSFLTR